jgi:hypothetical protein
MRKLTVALFLFIAGPAAAQSVAEHQRFWDQYERAMRRHDEALRAREAWRQRWEESLDELYEPEADTDHLRQRPNHGMPPRRSRVPDASKPLTSG